MDTFWKSSSRNRGFVRQRMSLHAVSHSHTYSVGNLERRSISENIRGAFQGLFLKPYGCHAAVDANACAATHQDTCLFSSPIFGSFFNSSAISTSGIAVASMITVVIVKAANLFMGVAEARTSPIRGSLRHQETLYRRAPETAPSRVGHWPHLGCDRLFITRMYRPNDCNVHAAFTYIRSAT
ncbi:hypothetical protein F1559_005162 [Cyanidiococcus yangmingshanensis]|uniref:Uncharacterized protein n=1 Tax=Cyanidiococcus yangmingshanensis TaxID=2690220 RepID=A0A7J7IRY0_9RHOD|nr:hypothetical protein F1559_005162 [Cyanidiococcus yangmingshanensis]